MSVSGFTIVRNAVKLDYPFREAVESVLPLCDEFVINCGQSEDGTEKLCESIALAHPGKVRVFYSVWQQENQKGGFQLKAQTDAALAACHGDWCLYIQADEAIHEADFPLIKDAMKRADLRPDLDGILFDYVHFYGSYDYSISGRNWYRREVRLLKNHRGIESFRDAQGFRKDGKRVRVIASGARVFHYGYVRTPASLGKKSVEMSKWWGEKPTTDTKQLELRRHVGLRRFQQSHPAAMQERIRNSGVVFNPKDHPRRWTKDEIKNAVTMVWESVFPFRIGEFKNYDLK